MRPEVRRWRKRQGSRKRLSQGTTGKRKRRTVNRLAEVESPFLGLCLRGGGGVVAAVGVCCPLSRGAAVACGGGASLVGGRRLRCGGGLRCGRLATRLRPSPSAPAWPTALFPVRGAVGGGAAAQSSSFRNICLLFLLLSGVAFQLLLCQLSVLITVMLLVVQLPM